MIEFFKRPEKYYENPIVTLRKKQLKALSSSQPSYSHKQIFESLPRNIRKKFMYELTYEKALDKCRGQFDIKLKNSLEYCIEIIA